jgi:hypothetical protein
MHFWSFEFLSLRDPARALDTLILNRDCTGGGFGGPDSSSPWEAIAGDVPPAPKSLDVTVLGDQELGMLGFPQTPYLSSDWG